MSKTFEQGKDEIAKLCEYFAKNQASFCAAGRKEAHVRQDLIDPLFRALGWDVGNAADDVLTSCILGRHFDQDPAEGGVRTWANMFERGATWLAWGVSWQPVAFLNDRE